MAGLSGRGGRKRNRRMMTQGANAQQAAYSKCRHGLLKGSELCTLCVVETALLVLSHGGKAFSFGHPAVDSVMNRFANCRKLDFDAIRCAEAEQEAVLNQLMRKRFDTLVKLEAEIVRGEQLKQMTMESEDQHQSLIDRPVDELNFEELMTLKSKMEELSEKLKKHMQERLDEPAASTSMSAGESNASLSGSTEGGSSADPSDQ